jgi:hypothetical protein
MTINLDFTNNIDNTSLQVGDLVYYVPHSPLGGFDNSQNDPTLIGEVDEILPNTEFAPAVCSIFPGLYTTQQSCEDNGGQWLPALIGFRLIVDNTATNITPSLGDFILFSKNSQINLSGLVGYYAEIKIVNDSKQKAEMYCMASEISLSSK